jgi:hypothetical protein
MTPECLITDLRKTLSLKEISKLLKSSSLLLEKRKVIESYSEFERVFAVEVVPFFEDFDTNVFGLPHGDILSRLSGFSVSGAVDAFSSHKGLEAA